MRFSKVPPVHGGNTMWIHAILSAASINPVEAPRAE
jgi:hypothetical protein